MIRGMSSFGWLGVGGGGVGGIIRGFEGWGLGGMVPLRLCPKLWRLLPNLSLMFLDPPSTQIPKISHIHIPARKCGLGDLPLGSVAMRTVQVGNCKS